MRAFVSGVNRIMNTQDWLTFFTICNQILGEGSHSAFYSESWCSWTTFDRLERDAGYWQAGMPNLHEFDINGIADGGTWGQPFEFDSIAHIIIPHKFEAYGKKDENFAHKEKTQNIAKLSDALNNANIKHVISKWALEIRLIENAG